MVRHHPPHCIFCRVVACRLVSAVEQNPALCGLGEALRWQNTNARGQTQTGGICLLWQRYSGDEVHWLICRALSQFSSYRTPRLAAIGSVSMA